MTSAGVATVAFIALAAVLYGAWTWRAWWEWNTYRPNDFSVVLVVWVLFHFVVALSGVVLVFGSLGSVAGWW